MEKRETILGRVVAAVVQVVNDALVGMLTTSLASMFLSLYVGERVMTTTTTTTMMMMMMMMMRMMMTMKMVTTMANNDWYNG